MTLGTDPLVLAALTLSVHGVSGRLESVSIGTAVFFML